MGGRGTKAGLPGAIGSPKEPPTPVNSKIDIQLITTKKFSHLCQEPGNVLYTIKHHSNTENSSTPHSELLNTSHSKTLIYSHSLCSSSLTADHMAGIPPEYHEFHEVFSGDKAPFHLADHMVLELSWRKEQSQFMDQYIPYR